MSQLRERFLILLMMVAVSIIFISCRELAIIPEIYVAVHNLRFTTLMTVMYFAGNVMFHILIHLLSISLLPLQSIRK